MDHRRLSALTCQCIHVTGAHRNIYLFLCLPADTFHIRSQKCIHTGDTDHHHRRLLLTAVADLFYRFRDLFQVTACNNIRLVHHQIKKSIIVLRHGADKRSIPSAASRCHDQHNGIRYCKPGTLYAKALRSRRVKCQSCRRAVDQMLPGDHLRRDHFQPAPGQFFCSCKICFFFHISSFSVSSLSNSFLASAKNFSLISEFSSPSITVLP